MMIVKDCKKCGNDYMYDPNNHPEYADNCQNCMDLTKCPVCGSFYVIYNMKQTAYQCESCAHWFDGSGILEHPIDCDCNDYAD